MEKWEKVQLKDSLLCTKLDLGQERKSDLCCIARTECNLQYASSDTKLHGMAFMELPPSKCCYREFVVREPSRFRRFGEMPLAAKSRFLLRRIAKRA